MTTSRSSNTRQKVTVIVFIAVIAIIGWQLYSLFVESVPTAPPPANQTTAQTPAQQQMTGTSPSSAAASPPVPPAAAPALPKPPVLSAKEIELNRLQKQAEERYVAAVNQLQMLKIEREIAETNKSIAAARLETATAEKEMASLAQPLNNPFSPSLAAPPPSSSSAESSSTVTNINYSVISVSYLQGRWSAVLGSQGKLYQIYIGDVLPDGNNIKVVDIDKSGVTIKIGEEKRKISLVPLI